MQSYYCNKQSLTLQLKNLNLKHAFRYRSEKQFQAQEARKEWKLGQDRQQVFQSSEIKQQPFSHCEACFLFSILLFWIHVDAYQMVIAHITFAPISIWSGITFTSQDLFWINLFLKIDLILLQFLCSYMSFALESHKDEPSTNKHTRDPKI